MDIEQKTVDDVLVISIVGHLDTNTSPVFETAVLEQIDKGARRVVNDCERLVYISSAGLRALMMAVRKLKPIGGKLGLSSIQEHLANSLKISGILTLFSVFDTLDIAIEKLQ